MGGTVSEANGTAERQAAEAMLKRQARCGRRITRCRQGLRHAAIMSPRSAR